VALEAAIHPTSPNQSSANFALTESSEVAAARTGKVAMVGREDLRIVDTSQPISSTTLRRPEVSEMNPSALLFLVLAIACEVAGTAGLKASEGFGRLGPSALAVLGYALAFYFLAQSLKYIPLGVAYAIWSGLGTVGSVLLGMLIWKEILGPVHILGIALIVVGVVVLNVAPGH
jgi:multidrug transporter EmrE-like cation transporter